MIHSPTKLQNASLAALSRAPQSGLRRRNYSQAKHPPFEPPVVDTVWRPNHAPVTLRTLHVKSLKKEDIVDVSSKRIRLRSPRPSVSQASPSGERLEDIGTPVVETVVPEKLASVQQHYLAYEIKDRQWSNNRTFTRVCPFPNNTRGLLYYRKHPKIPLAGSIRFCLARDPQQSDFSRPNNLLLDTGLPWQIDLLNLSASNRYKNLRDILIRDRLVPPQLFRHCSQMGQRLGHSITQWDQLVYEYRQPFFVDLSLPKSPIYLVNCYDIIRLKLQELFSCDVYPFKSGRIVCYFERDRNLPHYIGPTLHVKRVIEPVQFVNGYRGPVGPVNTGQPISRRGLPMRFLVKPDIRTVYPYTRWKSPINRDCRWAWQWDSYAAEFPEGWKLSKLR